MALTRLIARLAAGRTTPALHVAPGSAASAQGAKAKALPGGPTTTAEPEMSNPKGRLVGRATIPIGVGARLGSGSVRASVVSDDADLFDGTVF